MIFTSESPANFRFGCREVVMLKKIVIGFVMLVFFAPAFTFAHAVSDKAIRNKAHKAYSDGNYKDALEMYEKLCLDPENDSKQVGADLQNALNCMINLNRVADTDDFLDRVVETHAGNWRLLSSAANSLYSLPQYGYIVSGEFQRGHHRGGGKIVNTYERDRVRAFRLMNRALQASQQNADKGQQAGLCLSFANMILVYRGHNQAWRLQYLTDLSSLPDYEDGHYHRATDSSGAAVDDQGHPIFHQVPDSWIDATSDGQRWRWLLAEAQRLDPTKKNEVLRRIADFSHQQFGVQTMASYGYRFSGQDDGETVKTQTYSLKTLTDEETISRLATGIKRFRLPDDYGFIRLYKEINYHWKVAQIYENRRQYVKAVEQWTKSGNKANVQRIAGNWGAFEPVTTQPAGKGATVDFKFRNGKRVQFTAREIKVEKLLEDIKDYIRSNPRKVDWYKENLSHIGYRIVTRNEKQYVGRQIAKWSLDLDPRPNHFDRRITVTTPLQKAGAYLLTGEMANGNTSRIIIWINDTVIVKKTLDQAVLFHVADAVSGHPVERVNLEFFGYKRKWRNKLFGYRTDTDQFAEYTDKNGQVVISNKDPDHPSYLDPAKRWMIIATTPQGRLAYLGFTGVWYPGYHDYDYRQVKVFFITDRPVYRPNQAVHFKAWVRNAQYDQEDTSRFAGQTFTLQIHDSRGEKVYEKRLVADPYGGVSDKYSLPENAGLGLYRIRIREHGGGSDFRVEEYKKPEFEVKVEAPDEPVRLGETITATIKADYYFGAPVVNAKVKYKVLRYDHSAKWYPSDPWDWFYGNGYGWHAYDYKWYPGWDHWGCPRPAGWWYAPRNQPPEVVAENEVTIDQDGTVKVSIDTSVAEAFLGDRDHRYEITAEVTDLSRRTIVGRGNVLVARQPFKVYAWVDRGYYRTGDTIEASFKAQTLDRQPVQGKGNLKLFRITYDDRQQPVESAVHTWDLNPDAKGSASRKIHADQAGQYRLSYTVTDGKGNSIEGGYIFVVRGKDFDGAGFRFDNIELIPDKSAYRPDEKVRLMINTDHANAGVLLFIRPSNGIYLPPEMVRIDGKSTVKSVDIVQKDMPNFFIEAITIFDGKLHTEVREIMVPPQQRVLDVKIDPSKTVYRPGDTAQIKLSLSDANGSPFSGSLVISAYDRSVEYVYGGSNVPDIKSFYWKWRRRHHVRTVSNIERVFAGLLKKKERPMENLGVFGHLVADEDDNVLNDTDARRTFAASTDRGVLRGKSAQMKQVAVGAAMDSVAPAPRSAAKSAMKEEAAEIVKDGNGADKRSDQEMAEPAVRKEFADTAFWSSSIETDRQGQATVEFSMPENLTGWTIKAWAMGHGTKVGQAAVDVTTAKDFLIRMQAPRFFVQKDEVVLSANLHNYLDTPIDATAILELDGSCLVLKEKSKQAVRIDAESEARVDWRVDVKEEGEAVVRMKALSPAESDAMEMRFPVYVHGMDKVVSFSGVIRPDQTRGNIRIDVPEKRRINDSRLEIRFSPTLAGAMVDALPYLVDYPYGCTEQTLNRFVPAVITRSVLQRLGLDLENIRHKITNLNAQEIGNGKDRSVGWKRYDRNPVFDEKEVDKIVKTGIRRLIGMQVSDGGWGWFSGYGEQSYPHTTAVVVRGLKLAADHGLAVPPGVMEKGINWLSQYQNDQAEQIQNAMENPKVRPWKNHADNIDALIYQVLVDAGINSDRMNAFLYRDRNHLSVYAKAVYGTALHRLQQTEKLDMILKNIEQYLVTDDENQTAYLDLPNNGYWWYWYGSEIEAHAFYLKLLCRVNPGSKTASGIVKYLINNRKHSSYWNSTRDTALCIEAFADYLSATGEAEPDMTVEILVNGKKMKEITITSDNLFTFDNTFVLSGDAVETGRQVVELRRKGKGPLYYNAYLNYFTLQDVIPETGLEIKVRREFYRLEKRDKQIKTAGARGQVLNQKVEAYRRIPLENMALLNSGDLVEIELTLESKNDYEYIVFEDMKAAGLEAVDLKSGYYINGLGAYRELRDEKTAFFVRVLPRGTHSISYRLRAEIPGQFSALPTKAYGMYAPELRANSDEIKLRIED